MTRDLARAAARARRRTGLFGVVGASYYPLVSSRAPEERVGTVVADRYRIDEVLGVGGMGVVFGARHTWTDRSVALKILRSHLVDDPEAVRRFFLEAKAAAALRHPNVVDVLDMGRAEDGTVFLVLERLDGHSLAHALKERSRPFAYSEVLPILLPVLDALGAAHEAGVVHRDVKPDNIVLSRGPDGAVVPKLVDFGLAKLRRIQGAQETGTGILVGTPDYMSPEQAMGTREIGPPSDVWSLAVVFYECLAGAPPFRHESLAYTLVRILGEPIPSFGAIPTEIPPFAVEALDLALRRAPEERHATAGRLAAVLRGAPLAPERAGLPGQYVATLPPPSPSSSAVHGLGETLAFASHVDSRAAALARALPSPAAPSKSGSFRGVTVVRPYGPRIRAKVFPLLEGVGMRIESSDVIPAGTSDDEAVARVLTTGNDVLLVPFHGHVDDQGRRVDGLEVLRRLAVIRPSFPWLVIMPVSNFAAAAMTLALGRSGPEGLPDALRERLIVLTEEDLDARDAAAKLRAKIARASAA